MGSTSGRNAPIPSGDRMSGVFVGQSGFTTSSSDQSAKLPAPRLSQPSTGQVGVCAEVTDSAPTAPFCASCHSVGVSTAFTSSQRSPAAPAMIT